MVAPVLALTPTTPTKARSSRRTPLISAGIVLLIIAAAAASQSGGSGKTTAAVSSTSRPTTAPTRQTTQAPTATPTEAVATDEPTDEPTVEPDGPLSASMGEPVQILCNGQECETVAVDQVKFASRYQDPSGFYDDTPETPGYEYMAVHVIYKANGPNATYNEWDWAIYVNDEAGQDTTFVSHGPNPELQSGDLPSGKSAKGWLIYEVPKRGRIVISYQPSRNSIFEVVLRGR